MQTMRELSLNRQEVDYKGVKRCTDIFVNMPDLFDKDEDCNIQLKKHTQNMPDFVHSL